MVLGCTNLVFANCMGLGPRAWTPKDDTYFHFLTADLGQRRKVTAIATQGWPSGKEFVTEYIVQYSDDGTSWRSYTASGGDVKVILTLLILLWMSTKL